MADLSESENLSCFKVTQGPIFPLLWKNSVANLDLEIPVKF